MSSPSTKTPIRRVFRDFKESGYSRINSALREAGDINSDQRQVVVQLTRALMHLAMAEDATFTEATVYRGEVRNLADIGHLEDGDVL